MRIMNILHAYTYINSAEMFLQLLNLLFDRSYCRTIMLHRHSSFEFQFSWKEAPRRGVKVVDKTTQPKPRMFSII